MLQIFAPPLLERFYAQLTTVLHNFDVPVADWEVLALHKIWFLVLITVELLRGKSTDAAVLFSMTHHYEVIFLNDIFFVLLNYKPEVFNLTFDLLVNWSWLDDNCRLAGGGSSWWCLIEIILWSLYVVIHQILMEWLNWMNIMCKIGHFFICEVEVSLRSLHQHLG